jgi:hypothetical protein
MKQRVRCLVVDRVSTLPRKPTPIFREMLMLATKVDRHEKWLHQMAESVATMHSSRSYSR